MLLSIWEKTEEMAVLKSQPSVMEERNPPTDLGGVKCKCANPVQRSLNLGGRIQKSLLIFIKKYDIIYIEIKKGNKSL